MPFPVSVRGTFVVSRSAGYVDVRSAVILKAEELLATRSDRVEVVDQTVVSRPSFFASFTAPGSNWHPMVPFDVITLRVSGSEAEAVVAYALSTRRILRIVGFMALSMVIIIEAASIGHGGPIAALGTALKVAIGAFTWLFGMNFMLGWIRGPRWLRLHLSRYG